MVQDEVIWVQNSRDQLGNYELGRKKIFGSLGTPKKAKISPKTPFLRFYKSMKL